MLVQNNERALEASNFKDLSVKKRQPIRPVMFDDNQDFLDDVSSDDEQEELQDDGGQKKAAGGGDLPKYVNLETSDIESKLQTKLKFPIDITVKEAPEGNPPPGINYLKDPEKKNEKSYM